MIHSVLFTLWILVVISIGGLASMYGEVERFMAMFVTIFIMIGVFVAGYFLLI